MNRIKKLVANFKNKYQHHTIMNTLIIIFICYVQYISLDLSSIIIISPMKAIVLWAVTSFTLFFITMLLILILKKTRLSCTIIAVFVLLLSTINYWVYRYHGMPFMPSDIKNIGTVFNVLKTSKTLNLLIQPRLLIFIFCFIIELFFINFFEKSHVFKWKNSIPLLIFCGIGIYFSYYSSNPLIPNGTIIAVPEKTIEFYSYFPCFVKQMELSINSGLYMSDDYDENKVVEFTKKYSSNQYFNKYKDNINIIQKEINENELSNKYPDIILILNESFFDLDEYIETDSSIDYLYNYHNIEDAIKGYSVVPGYKGGTNLSEFELLTSNSYIICNNMTPYNDINLTDFNSIVSYLKSLGYSTMACHPQSAFNYKRNLAWSKLGFDKVYFEEDFKDLDYWANRTQYPTDKSTYKNMITWFEELDDSSPRFAFCITMQGHPFFDENKEEQNMVKSNKSWTKKETKTDVEEFLSSMSLSDQAFNDLIEYYKKYDKDIIIAMCGDHAPTIDLGFTYEDTEEDYLKILSTPFIIWSNNPDLYNNMCLQSSNIMR